MRVTPALAPPCVPHLVTAFYIYLLLPEHLYTVLAVLTLVILLVVTLFTTTVPNIYSLCASVSPSCKEWSLALCFGRGFLYLSLRRDCWYGPITIHSVCTHDIGTCTCRRFPVVVMLIVLESAVFLQNLFLVQFMGAHRALFGAH